MKNQESKQYYIFPNNYDDSGKFLGLIEYRTLVITVVWFAVTIGLYYALPVNIHIKVYGFIFTFFPPAIFLIIGINGDNVLDFIRYFIKFSKNAGVYTYNKDNGCREE